MKIICKKKLLVRSRQRDSNRTMSPWIRQ